MATRFVGDSFPYLLVEESLKKCQASERFRAILTQKVGMRADIEMQYIKKLQEWINDLDLHTPESDSVDAYLGSDLIKKILDGMRQEAQTTAESRQLLYNILMSDNGPYFKIQDMSKDASQKTVQETGVHFSQLFNMRNEADKTCQQHIEMSEHLRNQIEALETQLSKTSRITSARRSASKNGSRKIDNMREQVSELRQKCSEEEDQTEKSEMELRQTELAAQEILSDMEKTLRDIEITRIQTIINVIKSYIESIQKHQTQRSLKGNKSNSPLGSLESAQKLVRLHWLDVRSRAKQGGTAKIQNMFESSSPNTKKRFATIRNVLNQVLVDSQQNSEAQAFDRTDSLLAHFNSRKSGSESSVEGDAEGASAMGFISTMEYKRVTMPSKKTSQESIESLVLPPEVRCKADITQLEPNKQYVTRMRLAKHDDFSSPRAHMTEYSNIRRYTLSPEASDEDDEDDCVAKLHNVRVVAIEDSDPLPDSELLAFKSGQIIKQKIGENENGYCYGWTRENRIGKKQYGIYKTSAVRLFKKTTNI